ncbi:uncharacterized protein IAS62_000088 [Cryptococcus decagattii]|uniref:Uncharacterized protein n=1 Tax=Cryptococcus decagattii TaxID=1859122 RepID=A0ABZ2ANB0_9TREE
MIHAMPMFKRICKEIIWGILPMMKPSNWQWTSGNPSTLVIRWKGRRVSQNLRKIGSQSMACSEGTVAV